MIRKQGVLKAYSGRSMERTIGQYKKLIKSKSKSGENAGNILDRFALFNYINTLDIDIGKKVNLLRPRLYTSLTFESLDTNDPSSPQLWSSPLKNYYVSSLPCNISSLQFKTALVKYYQRSSSTNPVPQIDVLTVSGRCWNSEIVYSSLLHRNHIKETRRGNHYIMFNVLHKT